MHQSATHSKHADNHTETDHADIAGPAWDVGNRAVVHSVGALLAITAIILSAMSLRPGIVSIGPILPSIIERFSLSHATASLLTAIPSILMGIMALPSPWLARRFGRDPVLLLALILVGLSTAARAFSVSTFGLLLSTVGVGTGIAIAGTLIAGFIKARFPTRAAVLMGIYATALSFGGAFSAATTGAVAARLPDGWRFASGMWSVVSVIAILGWLPVLLSERRHRALVPVPEPVSAVRLPLRNRTAWLIAIFFACLSFVFYALLAWIAPMYHDAGLSTTVSGLILASFTAAFMCANPILGWISKSDDRRSWLAICSVITLLGLIPIAVTQGLASGLAPFVFVPVCAFGLGGAFTLGMTLPLDNASSVEEANAWNAFVLMVGYLVAAAGPLVVGRLRDLNGDFRPSLWLLVVVAIAMLMLTPFLKPHRPGHRLAA
jgi:CP family cyanate transporter-like MFS transporter